MLQFSLRLFSLLVIVVIAHTNLSANQGIKKQLLVKTSDWRGSVGEVVFSPDYKHYAFTVRDKTGMYVVRDGKRLKTYDYIARDLVFSPDSKKLAYISVTTGGFSPCEREQRLVLDTKEYAGYRSVLNPRFSPDSQRIHFGGLRGDWISVLDGKEGDRHVAASHLEFSANSKHTAFSAAINKQKEWYIVYDRKRSRLYELVSDPVMSRDGDDVYYVARENNQAYVVKNGKRISDKYYHITNLMLSPDDKVLVYTIQKQKDGVTYVWYQGKMLGPYSRIAPRSFAFSRYGKVFAYTAERNNKVFVVHNGVEQTAFTGYSFDEPVLSPDGQNVVHVVHGKKDAFVVMNGKRVTVTDANGQRIASRGIFRGFVFSPDSKTLAFTAIGANGKTFLVSDGKVRHIFNNVSMPVFSSDSKNIAYIARKNKEHFLVINHKIVGPFHNLVGAGLTTDRYYHANHGAYLKTKNRFIKFLPGNKVRVFERDKNGDYYRVVVGI